MTQCFRHRDTRPGRETLKPVKITEKHTTLLRETISKAGSLWHKVLSTDDCPECDTMREIESLLRSLSDGSRDTFDTREEVKVPRDEALKVYGAMQACGLHGNFLHIITRWLTPDGEKR